MLAGTPSVRCAIVRSGTSRVVVLDGDTIRPGAVGRSEVLRIMLGSDYHGGLGGATSQENKVALVWPPDDHGRFRFRFLQVVAHSRTVLPMECSNAASATAMVQHMRQTERDRHGLWRTKNLSTGQAVELRPDRTDGTPRAWSVRFVLQPKDRAALAGLGPTRAVRVPGGKLRCTPVLRGNLFLFTEADPSDVTPEMLDAVADAGMRSARAEGFDPPTGYHPKVVPYRVTHRGRRSELRAASFYHGELHRSMPGSASMALAAFSEMRLRPEDGIACDRWTVHHPSGDFEVRLGIDDDARGLSVGWSEFTTPVAVIEWGRAALPWRRAA